MKKPRMVQVIRERDAALDKLRKWGYAENAGRQLELEREAERERCAKVAEGYIAPAEVNYIPGDIAAAIREAAK